MKTPYIILSLSGLLAAFPLVAADRQVVIEPASWMTFTQQVMTSKVNTDKNLRAGVFHAPGKRLMRVFTVSEFALPAASADEVRMASLQLVPGRRQCKGNSPLALSLYAYAGDGTAEFTDTQGGTAVQTREDACQDTAANAQPIDVTSAIKTQLANGAKFIGFSLRPASDRIGEAMINFHGPTASDEQRHRLIVVLAGRSGAGTGATSAPSFDISGVRLGMTPDEARRTLQARSRDYQFKDHRAPIDRSGSAPFLSMVTATLPERIAAGPLESYGVQFPPPPHAGKAIFIERYGVFKPGQEPLLADVKASLLKKYGEPSYVDDHARETTLIWAFNPAGTQMVEKAVFKRCVRHLPTDPLSLARPNELLYDRQSEGCGLTVYARIARNQIRGSVPMAWGDLATLLSVSMTDDSQFPAMRLAFKNHQAQGERQAAKSFDLEAAPVATPQAAAPSAAVAADTPWLLEMPQPAKVLAEIRGKDELDTAARQAGAFVQLRNMIGTLAGPRLFRNQRNDEEKRLMQMYAEAEGKVSGPVITRFNPAETQRLGMNSPRAKWFDAYTGYSLDKGFTDELLKRFFTSAFSTFYKTARSGGDARAESGRIALEKSACLPRCPPETALKPAADSPSLNPETPAKPDPSIAKAKAAGVDTKVFGVPLGEPLRLPRCATANERKNARQEIDFGSAFRGVQTSTTCQSDGAIMAFIGALLGGKGADRYIMLSKDSCPNWAYCEVVATLHEGNLAGVAVMILPGAGEDTVGKQLRAKYGKPTRKETVQYQNEYGARYEVDELEWVLPGLHVEYKPGPKGGGVVAIVTETGYKALKAKEAVQEAQQPKL
jgi:hypothetical protein